MRIMPFMKRKNGVQFAGIGLDTGGGGGGGGGGSSSVNYVYNTDAEIRGGTWVETKTNMKYMGKDVYAFGYEDTSSSNVFLADAIRSFVPPQNLKNSIDTIVKTEGVLTKTQSFDCLSLDGYGFIFFGNERAGCKITKQTTFTAVSYEINCNVVRILFYYTKKED